MSSKLEKLKQLRKSIELIVKGMDNYPKNITVMVFANHSCLMDIFYIPMILPEESVSVISARLMYKNDLERQMIINKYINPIPIEAHGGRYYIDSCINNASKILTSGISMSIFPEGVYIKDKNKIYRGRTGGARILFDARVNNPNIKLVPISIKYEKEIKNIDSYYPEDNIVDINILEPIDYETDFERFMNSTDFNEKNQFMHNVVDSAMKSIADSLNEEYDSNYFELDPKRMIFTDGRILSEDESNQDTIQKLYTKHINMHSRKMCERIKNIIKF